MLRMILAVCYTAMLTPCAVLATELEKETDLLTLEQALEWALDKSPELMVVKANQRIRQASGLQEGLRPNPEVEVETENFAGGGALKGFDGAETTISFGQRIELAGKRQKRKRVAALTVDQAGWDYKNKYFDVVKQTSLAFTDVVAGQRRALLHKELYELAQEVHKSVKARIEAGKVSPLEGLKSEVSVANAQMRWRHSHKQLQALRTVLAGSWGTSEASFAQVKDNLDSINPLPPFAKIMNRVSNNPEIARWLTEQEHREAVVALEKAQRIPDITLKGGHRFLNESNENAWTIGVSVPLPMFNRNQGKILKAHEELAVAGMEKHAAEVRVKVRLNSAYQNLLTTFDQLQTLQNEVLPAAERAFQGIGEGYRMGKFDYLDVLDAQRTFFEARGQFTEEVVMYHRFKAELERLIGGKLSHLETEGVSNE